MKVYLTRDVLNTGKIEEGEGTPKTGLLGVIQVNGKRPCERDYYPTQWYATLEEAREWSLVQFDRKEQSLERSLERLAEELTWIRTLKESFVFKNTGES